MQFKMDRNGVHSASRDGLRNQRSGKPSKDYWTYEKRNISAIEGGHNQKSLIYVEDLVEIIASFTNSSMNSGIYNIAADSPLSILQIAEALQRGLGRSPIYIPVHEKIAKMVTRFRYPRFQALAQKMEAFASTTTVDTSAIRNRFHFPFHPTEEILTQIAASSLRVA